MWVGLKGIIYEVSVYCCLVFLFDFMKMVFIVHVHSCISFKFTFCMILLPELLLNVIMYMSARITRCIAENAHCVYCKRKLTESADGRAYWDTWVEITAPWQEYFDFCWHNFPCSPLVTVTLWHFLVWHPLPTRCCGSVRSFVCHGLYNYVIGDY